MINNTITISRAHNHRNKIMTPELRKKIEERFDKEFPKAETLAIICSLSKKNLLPFWFYYLDWMSEKARTLALGIMYESQKK